MESPWIAAAIVIFLWWFLTAVILLLVRWADNKGERAHARLVICSSPLLVFGMYGFLKTLQNVSVAGVYIAFLSALALWSWIEIAFLSGLLTGSNRRESPPELSGYRRFVLAWRAVAYSEIALFSTIIILFWSSVGATNLFGLFTFLVLYLARLSAKLNLFFGVPKINKEFLPDSISHLQSHFKISKTNKFFPFSVLGLISLAAICFSNVTIEGSSADHLVGFTLLSVLTLLAVLEHFFMILRIPDAALWRWIIPKKNLGRK